MKTIYIFILGLLWALGSFAQQTPEFEFHLYFEDALGNRDAITIGYDPAATNGIDAAFGEENILHQPWSENTFEIRITDRMATILDGFGEEETFHTKKQIVDNQYCTDIYAFPGRSIYIDVKNPVFPIKILFDTNLYQNQCIIGSTIDIQDPRLHMDTPDGPWYYYDFLFLPLNGDGQYLPFERDVSLFEELVYQDVDGEYIYTYLLTLRDERFITLNTQNLINDSFQLFPNPFVTDITLPLDSSVINLLQIKDLNGRLIDFELNGNSITPLNCSKGVYFLSFETNGKMYTNKIVKQ